MHSFFLPRLLQKPNTLDSGFRRSAPKASCWNGRPKNRICVGGVVLVAERLLPRASNIIGAMPARALCGWQPGPKHCVVSREMDDSETNAPTRAEAEKDLLVGPAEVFGGSPANYGRSVADGYFSKQGTAFKKTERIQRHGN